MGVEPETMAEAARSLDAMGFDIVDLNFACPVRKVVSHKRGGALMNDPARALATVAAVIAAVPGRPVTLKLRRSFRNDDRTHESFWTIARGAFEAWAWPRSPSTPGASSRNIPAGPIGVSSRPSSANSRTGRSSARATSPPPPRPCA